MRSVTFSQFILTFFLCNIHSFIVIILRLILFVVTMSFITAEYCFVLTPTILNYENNIPLRTLRTNFKWEQYKNTYPHSKVFSVENQPKHVYNRLSCNSKRSMQNEEMVHTYWITLEWFYSFIHFIKFKNVTKYSNMHIWIFGFALRIYHTYKY